jgi:hypothetical protein
MFKRIATASLPALLIALLVAPAGAVGQTRKRSTSSRPGSTASATQRVSQARTAGAQRVAEQIKLMTKFVYLLGGVTSGIAAVDEAARRNEATPELLQRNQQNKATVKTSIQGFREGLDRLEIDFRNQPDLQPFYIKLAGSAAGAATAEEQAAANQFDAAGRSLLTVIGRLADVLVIMRQ